MTPRPLPDRAELEAAQAAAARVADTRWAARDRARPANPWSGVGVSPQDTLRQLYLMGGAATPSQYAAAQHVPLRVAAARLRRALDAGLLDRVRDGRTFCYRVPPGS